MKERKANWIVHVLRRNCLIIDVIEGKEKGKMEVTRRRRRKYKQLLDELKGKKKVLELELSGGLSLEEDVDMSQDRLRNH
jgi:hypothetical protein